MSRRLANRPRFHTQRIYPRSLRLSHREYLREHWTYRQQRNLYPKHSLGYGLSLLPIGWRKVRDVIRRQA